jgi:hypothetical protein
MELFDQTNPTHIRILKEELARAKRIISENTYSADKIWAIMTPDERKTALYAAKSPNPDDYVEGDWDSIPADTQDLIDLFAFEPSSMSQHGRSLLRGTRAAMQEDPLANRLVSAFLRNAGKAAIEQLNYEQLGILNRKVWMFVKRDQNNVQTLGGPSADEYRANQGRGGWQGD